MISRDIEISNKLGLHARAAAKLVNLASGFGSHIELHKEDKNANAKSIMAVMMLAASQGSMLTISADGDDENQAMEQIIGLFNDKFGEEE